MWVLSQTWARPLPPPGSQVTANLGTSGSVGMSVISVRQSGRPLERITPASWLNSIILRADLRVTAPGPEVAREQQTVPGRRLPEVSRKYQALDSYDYY